MKSEDRRVRLEMWFVLLGVFDAGFWNVRVEYAKNSPRDLLCRYTVSNESDNAAVIHVLPTLWFRSDIITTLLLSCFLLVKLWF